MSTRIPADTRRCDACLVAGRETPATHGDVEGRGYVWCDEHSMSGDPPLNDTTREAARQQAGWPLSRLDGTGY